MNQVVRIFPALVLLSSVLCVFYLYENGEKIEFTQNKLSFIAAGERAKYLEIRNKNTGEQIKFDLPTSDLMDRTGHLPLNFSYLSKEKFSRLASDMDKNQFFLNGQKINNVQVSRLHKKALSVVLPESKLYIFAPPHMQMAIRALKYERKARQDIFSCNQGREFCQSVKVVGFGGITDVVEATLKKDVFYKEQPFPRGRWLSSFFGLSLYSTKDQKVNIRYTLKTPIVNQTIKLNKPRDARLTILRSGELNGLKIPGVSLGDLVFNVQADLRKGSNIIEIRFGTVTERNLEVPMEMAGILTNLSVLPAN